MEEGFKFPSPEAEIEYLEKKILEKKQELKEKETKSVVSEVLLEHAKTVAPPASGAASSPAYQPQNDDTVKGYIQIALESGVSKAIVLVRQTRNPHLIDAFHDALTDHFLDTLIAKGLLDAHG